MKDWADRAACRGMDTNLFFANGGRGGRSPYEHARPICHGCPVRVECLEEALRAEQGYTRHERFGMYGGLTPGERARYGKPRKVLA